MNTMAVSVSVSGKSTSAVEEYDPATDTWKAKSPIPAPALALSASVLGGRIYAIGGNATWAGAANSTVYAYDPATDTWAKEADMPTARMYLATAVVNDMIYAIGGSPQAAPYLPISAVEIYAPGVTCIEAFSWGAVKATFR